MSSVINPSAVCSFLVDRFEKGGFNQIHHGGLTVWDRLVLLDVAIQGRCANNALWILRHEELQINFSRLDYDTEGFPFSRLLGRTAQALKVGTGHMSLSHDMLWLIPSLTRPGGFFRFSLLDAFSFFLVASVNGIIVGIIIRTAFFSHEKTLRDQTALIITTE